MDYTQAAMVRHIMQHHVGSLLQVDRGAVQAFLDLDEEELDALVRFVGDVSCHVLEGLVPEDQLPPRW